MISRRQLLRASLTVCGCAMCNELGISTFADSARADSPTAIKGTGYDLWFIGGQRETIMNGKLAAVLDLGTLASRQQYLSSCAPRFRCGRRSAIDNCHFTPKLLGHLGGAF
jgi:hypothetical protein